MGHFGSFGYLFSNVLLWSKDHEGQIRVCWALGSLTVEFMFLVVDFRCLVRIYFVFSACMFHEKFLKENGNKINSYSKIPSDPLTKKIHQSLPPVTLTTSR